VVVLADHVPPCVPVNAARCIRLVKHRPEHVLLELAQGFRRRVRLVQARVLVGPLAVPGSATFLAE
jgi:hypothetical protein